MQNPYQTLGVERNASSDEIKKAYRRLSRIYHPDANINNPNKKQAETRFKEVQEAYNQIMKEREQGNSGYENTGYGGQAFYKNREESNEFQAIRNYLNAGHYQEAFHILQNQTERTARWFYYSAIANAGVGNNILALEHARKAQDMEPANMEYRMLVSKMESGGQWYQTMGRDYAYPAAGLGNCCWQMLCINIFCNCCCRPV